jgi:NAD(P)-dependent dehydrogenase (short-subunit alcohol dehydrogenase family)
MRQQRELDLSGKVAVITGASRGIGKRTALKLAQRGVNVVVAARSMDSHGEVSGTLRETVAEIESLGAEALAVGVDLSEEDDLKRLVQAAVDRFGGVDILINNAAVTTGYSYGTPLLQIPRADWLYQFAVNVHAPFTLVQLVVPTMTERGGGRILNVTTGSAEVLRQPEELPGPLNDEDGPFWNLAAAYFASKRALDRFANVIAPQLARQKIFIISLHPGFVASELAMHNVEAAGLDGSTAISMDVPARMMAYFAACADPAEYTGRIFWAEREIAELGLDQNH